MRLRLSSFVFAAVTAIGGMAVSPALSEPPGEAAHVDKLFERWDKPTSAGCAVAVMKDGGIVYKRGYGMADLDHDVPITPATVFHVASVSKQFTAAAVLMLAQESKLSLDDPVKKYVPELPDFGVPITLRHLLHHTSGLRDQWELLGLAGWRYSLDLITDADILAVLSRQKALNFAPGSEYLYSNTGYTLLAQVLKRVSGDSLRNFTTARLFRPLGMEHTHFRDDHAEIVKNIAYGYESRAGAMALSVTNFDTVGATSLLTTVEDLALWDENFYTARVGGDAVIKALQERGHLNDGTPLDYAAGLEVKQYRGLNIVDHAGADAGYRADLIRFPDQHFSVATLCNLAATDPSTLNRAIADIYLASAFIPASEAVATVPQPSPDRLAELAGVYVDADDGDRVLQLRFENGRLWGGSPTGRRFELKALNDSRFRYLVFPTELDFSANETGAPGGLTAYVKTGKPLRFRRASHYQPTSEQLKEFAGVYRSDEIESRYEVIVQDDRLVVHAPKLKDAALDAVEADLFMDDFRRVRFTRDAQGHVSGASLSTGRIRHLRFERVPQ